MVVLLCVMGFSLARPARVPRRPRPIERSGGPSRRDSLHLTSPRPPRLGPSIAAHRRSDRPVAPDLGEDLLEDDLPPGDELAAGPVPSIPGEPRAERVGAGGGQSYRFDRARANR
jgi:hypothetical protein